MKLATIKTPIGEEACVILKQHAILIRDLNTAFKQSFEEDLFSLIEQDQITDLITFFNQLSDANLEKIEEKLLSLDTVTFGPLYRTPNKIWGIGLNYTDHASDLSEISPFDEPASFMKPSTTIIGYGDNIELPIQSQKTTGEAELGVIFGKKCKNIEKEDWLSVVAGFTTIIDMTAEDILRKNPRFLTRSKSFDTFFSFGPIMLTPDEIDDVTKLNVATVINNKVYEENVVSNMMFTPDYLVSFHSKVMTMMPGDIISTGTPRAVELSHKDIIECRITGFTPLLNPVVDKKETVAQ
jgi:2-keto-4-pentenoate hydratase/2-oxohepta-3-ene-1,7-dioic acid hydratase in catechol pathway